MAVIVQNPMDVIISLNTEDELTGEQMFALADALDGYEIEKGIKEKLVVDIVEISSAGIFAVHVIPKQMLTYEDLIFFINDMVGESLKRDDIPFKNFSVKKVLFRTAELGKPSEVAEDMTEIREKVNKLWKGFKKDSERSYV
ncbi:MAG: hypothetical protein MUC62_05205 [Candidatus Thermoplasmatota archaeon]|nr:hypothetical protein [Candidatus Thermoplasmatota archaeon]